MISISILSHAHPSSVVTPALISHRARPHHSSHPLLPARQAFEIVARPALDSFESALDRTKMAIYKTFARWGLPCPITGSVHTGGEVPLPELLPALPSSSSSSSSS